jgi:dolichyl-phosphate beta-glucosyltransferase
MSDSHGIVPAAPQAGAGADRVTPDASAQARPQLSIIIPALNEEHRLPPSLEKITTFMAAQPISYEIIVVDNGSRDRTAEVVLDFARTHLNVRLIQLKERGKGRAVKAGMLAAHGDYRFICDTDLSMPIEEITKFLPPQVQGFDVIIATREGKEAQRIGEPAYRHLMGRVNNIIIKIMAIRKFEDTQCGFKMFTRAAAEDLFSVQLMNGIGFDVEILFIAIRRGYKIREVPIMWYFDPDSRMRLVQDSLNMLREIWQIRQNWNKGLYARRDTQNSPT